MRNSLADVVAAALRVLDAQGLENCSMRRVAAELDVQPSALYHHVADKQTLLALMADEIVRGADLPGGVRLPDGAEGRGQAAGQDPDRVVPTETDPRVLCVRLREAMLAVRDGADVVATAAAFRMGSSAIEDRLAALVGRDGARTLLLYTFGQTQSTQTHRQAAAFGALVGSEPAVSNPDPSVPDRSGTGFSGAGFPEAGFPESQDDSLDASFGRGIDIILAGLAAS